MRVHGFKVRGFNRVNSRLNYALRRAKIRGTQGLTDIALDIHNEANFMAPLIPKDTGNLISSRFVINNFGQIPRGSHPHFTSRDHLGRYHRGRARAAYIDHQNALARFLPKATRSKKPKVILGYSVSYAIYPHEMGIQVHKGRTINWTRYGSGPKYFQTALNRKAGELLRNMRKVLHFGGRGTKVRTSQLKIGARRPR